MIKPTDEVCRLPLQQRLDLAAQETYRKVLEDHRRAGIPLVILRDGKVVKVPAEELLFNGTENPHVNHGSPDGQ